MKNLSRAVLLLIGIIPIVFLFAFLEAKSREKITISPSPQVRLRIVESDPETGLPVLRSHHNKLIHTRDISPLIVLAIVNQLEEAEIFMKESEVTVIAGKEPNNFVLFFQMNGVKRDEEIISKLPALAHALSANALNHQPVVIKVIDEKKEIVKVVM
ncbi:MAG TPA: hypothetical protein VM012_07285 [Flavitalea sp.]|nr:hypothetical protein [Flavitalea sp.]